MEGKKVNNFLTRKWKLIIYANYTYVFHVLYIVYVVGAFITLNWKVQPKYMSPFSNLP